MINKQMAWQLRQKEIGNCIICGKPSYMGKLYCIRHGLLVNEQQRKRKGLNNKRNKGFWYKAAIREKVNIKDILGYDPWLLTEMHQMTSDQS